jgi:hypothetical protein
LNPSGTQLAKTVDHASRFYAEKLRWFFTQPTITGERVNDDDIAAFLSYGQPLSHEPPPLKEQLSRIRFRRHLEPIDLADVANTSDSFEQEHHDLLEILLNRTDTHNHVTARLLYLLEQ